MEDVDAAATSPVLESEFVSEDDKEDGSIAKQALMAEMSGGMAGPKPDKAAIGEILLALEARNPTPSPATSELLNGKWKVLYATGASPGLKALTLLLKGAEQASSPPPPRPPAAHPPPARRLPAGPAAGRWQPAAGCPAEKQHVFECRSAFYLIAKQGIKLKTFPWWDS